MLKIYEQLNNILILVIVQKFNHKTKGFKTKKITFVLWKIRIYF